MPTSARCTFQTYVILSAAKDPLRITLCTISSLKKCVTMSDRNGGSKPPPYGISGEMFVGRGLAPAEKCDINIGWKMCNF